MEQVDKMLKSLVNKRVLITGGSKGIGRAITELLVNEGANCMICGRHEEDINETIALLAGAKGQCVGMIADISKGQHIEQLFTGLDELLGGIDILINNAAIGAGSVTDDNYETWEYTLKTNLLSYIACSHHAIERMKAIGSGHIVNIGSMSANVREVGSAVYVATKAGIQGFSESLRKQLNPQGIKVSLIEPGAVDTDMQPDSSEQKASKINAGEMLKAKDIALAVAFCLVQPWRSDVVQLQIRPHMQII